jgi:hypothetical protein
MTLFSDETKKAADGAASAMNRRNFIAAATAAGLAIPAMAAAQTPPSTAGDASTPTPDRLGPHAMLDNRFPITYQKSIPAGINILTQYFVALAERNLQGIADVTHFPYASVEGTDPVVVQTADDLLKHPPASLNTVDTPERFTDHDGYMKAGAYDVLENIEVVNFDPVTCGLVLNYNRYDGNGKKLLRCEGVYSVTNNDGRWGLQMASTIFTPAHMTGLNFTDTIEQAKRCRINHDLAYHVCDRNVDATTTQLGTTVGVDMIGGAPWVSGPHGDAMKQFQVGGVKSRLRVTEVTPDKLQKASANPVADYDFYRVLFPQTGVGNWGFVYGMIPETRVIHSTFNKAHMFSGAMRFTTSGDECSYNTDLSVVTFTKLRWGRVATMAYTTPHDRSNDVLPPKRNV